MILLPAFFLLVQDVSICVSLLCLLVFFTWAIVKFEQKRPVPMLPANDADDEADALPFGPTPSDVD